jgi:histidine triad (HIT) family protein
MSDCLFCRLAGGEINASIVFQDDRVTAFRDINPQAPVHVLLIPNEHITSTDDVSPSQDETAGRLLRTAASVAEQEGLRDKGYRLVVNCGRQGGQAVPHLHVHLLGGRVMGWPPG